jgi:hypothetical protein
MWQVVGLGTLISAIVALHYSAPAITPGDIDPSDPLFVPFVITNHNLFPIDVVERRCIVNATYPDHADMNQQWVYPLGSRTVSVSGSGGETSYGCPFSPAEGFTTLSVRLLVQYRVFGQYFPLWRTSRDLRYLRDSRGTLHAVGLDPDRPQPGFAEYGAPTYPGWALFYYDIVGLNGCSCSMGFTSPDSGKARVVWQNQAGNVIHRIMAVSKPEQPAKAKEAWLVAPRENGVRGLSSSRTTTLP